MYSISDICALESLSWIKFLLKKLPVLEGSQMWAMLPHCGCSNALRIARLKLPRLVV